MSSNELSAGMVLSDRYELGEIVGSGKSSTLFRATDRKLNLTVAIKLLDPFLAQDPLNIERFKREVRILRELDHPGVIKVYDICTEGKYVYIVMEYFPSVDGARKLKRDGPPSLEAFLEQAKKIAQIVQACHERKIVHRDLKPQNILFNEKGDIKLVDFGISKMTSMSDLTKTGTSLGTPDYMPPEACREARTDARGEGYALGTIFYQMLTGYSPFESLSMAQLMREKASSTTKPVSQARQDVPQWLSDVIAKCMQTDPVNRYQSCKALLADLDHQEKSIATRTKGQDGGNCIHCKAPMIAGLAFCHSCGKFRSDALAAGVHSIVIYRIESPTLFMAYLNRNFPGALQIASQSKLKKPPVLLLKNCDQQSAIALCNELYSVSASASVVKDLPREFLLPPIYFIIAGLGLIPLPFIDSVSMRLVVICAIEAAIFGLFHWRMVPVIRAREKKKASSIHPLMTKMAATAKGLSDNRIQAILGRIALSFQNFINSSAQSMPPQILKDFEGAIDKCIQQAESLQTHARYLHERSVSEIRKKLDVLNHRIQKEKETPELELLIQQKTLLMAEYKNYREIQDAYSEGTSALLNFLDQIQQMERGPSETTRSAA